MNVKCTLAQDQVALRAGYEGRLSRRLASHAVVNPTNKCSLSCAHCLFSAPLQKQAGAPDPDELTSTESTHLGNFLSAADVRQLVISGGGEPLENLPAVIALLESSVTVEELVVITSGHYAQSEPGTAKYLDALLEAFAQHRASERLIVRLSADVGHRIDPSCYRRVVQWAGRQDHGPVEVRAILRSSMSDLIRGTAGSWLSAFGLNTQSIGTPGTLPVVDGMPVAWFHLDDIEVPVIFKPDYGLGFARSVLRQDWKDLVSVEERAGTPFNLSWRGPRGEGHNYYGAIIHGKKYCESLLDGRREYVSAKRDQEKGLSLYATASGRLYVNAGPPDAWLTVKYLPNWEDVLKRYDQDALMNLVVNNPTTVLYGLAREVDAQIGTRADAENFVFSPARLSLRTTRLRTYLAQIQHSLGFFSDPLERSHAWELLSGLDKEKKEQSRYSDPIVGNVSSIYEH